MDTYIYIGIDMYMHTYIIINDYGHLVPSDQPLAAMEMVDHYINKKVFTEQLKPKVWTNKNI